MSEALYQRAIMERAARAVGDHRLTDPDASATVDNPLCGDRVTLDVRLADGRIAAVGYRVRGCALCQAATTVIAEAAPGATAAEAAAGETGLRAVLAGSIEKPQERWSALAIFAPVGDHRSRHDCVRLPFDALADALGRLTTGPR